MAIGYPACPICEVFRRLRIRVEGTLRPRRGMHGAIHVSEQGALILDGSTFHNTRQLSFPSHILVYLQG